MCLQLLSHLRNVGSRLVGIRGPGQVWQVAQVIGGLDRASEELGPASGSDVCRIFPYRVVYRRGNMLLRDLEGETVWNDVLDWIGRARGAAAH